MPSPSVTWSLRRGARAVLVAALLSGCGEGTGTSPGGPTPGVPGTYLLQAPLPVFDDLVPDPEGDFHLRVVATGGSLVLMTDSRYQHEVHLEAYVDGQLSGRQGWVDRGDWRAAGDTLHFESGFIGNLVFRGVREDHAVKLVQDLVGEGITAEYPFHRASSQ